MAKPNKACARVYRAMELVEEKDCGPNLGLAEETSDDWRTGAYPGPAFRVTQTRRKVFMGYRDPVRRQQPLYRYDYTVRAYRRRQLTTTTTETV